MATGGNWLIGFANIMESLIEVLCLTFSLTHCSWTQISHAKMSCKNGEEILRNLNALRMLLKRLFRYDSLISR